MTELTYSVTPHPVNPQLPLQPFTALYSLYSLYNPLSIGATLSPHQVYQSA